MQIVKLLGNIFSIYWGIWFEKYIVIIINQIWLIDLIDLFVADLMVIKSFDWLPYLYI
jgi:hypothetical protein